MPAYRYRTKSHPKRFVKAPGGETKIHYKKKRAGAAHCSFCGNPLSGVPVIRPQSLRTFAKSSRRPNRPFGGNLCPSCSRRAIKEIVRGQ